MTALEKYTEEERRTLEFAPLWAFGQVAGIDSKIDDKEVEALTSELAQAGVYKAALVREVLMAIANDLPGVMSAYQADGRKVDAGLQEAATLVETKEDAENALMFKGAIMGISVNVAKASGSMFGDKASKEEQLAIGYIGTLLRFSPDEFNRIAPTFKAN